MCFLVFVYERGSSDISYRLFSMGCSDVRAGFVVIGNRCAICYVRGCCPGLGQTDGSLGPPAPLSLRVRVLPRCFFTYVLLFMCFIRILVTLGEGIYFSYFLCVLSKCMSSISTGLLVLCVLRAVISRSPRGDAVGSFLLFPLVVLCVAALVGLFAMCVIVMLFRAGECSPILCRSLATSAVGVPREWCFSVPIECGMSSSWLATVLWCFLFSYICRVLCFLVRRQC